MGVDCGAVGNMGSGEVLESTGEKVHEAVAHELRPRDFVNISINSLVDCASESNRAHVIV